LLLVAKTKKTVLCTTAAVSDWTVIEFNLILLVRYCYFARSTGRLMVLGSTKPLTEMSKGGRCAGLTLPPSCADCREIWEPQPPATLRACPDL